MSYERPHGHITQALNRLLDIGWEIEEVIEVTEWWARNVWKLTSIKQAFGMKLFITPLTDRTSEAYDSKDIEIIRASSEVPNDFYDISSVISDCFTNTRRFEKKLDEFISEIEKFRNNS